MFKCMIFYGRQAVIFMLNYNISYYRLPVCIFVPVNQHLSHITLTHNILKSHVFIQKSDRHVRRLLVHCYCLLYQLMFKIFKLNILQKTHQIYSDLDTILINRRFFPLSCLLNSFHLHVLFAEMVIISIM